VRELALISRNFHKPPSAYWGFTDLDLILDFDRLHSIRLQFFDAEIRQREAEAISSGTENNAMPKRLLEDEISSSALRH
jgi:hypothetical protein